MAVRRRKKASQQQGRSMPRRVTDPDDTGTPTTTTTSQRARLSSYYSGGILGALVVVVLMIVVLVGMNILEVGGPPEQEAAADASVTPPPAAAPSAAAASSRPPTFTPGSVAHRGSFRVLAQYPHDAAAFTQGLEVANATHAYESTGLYGESTVRLVEVSTGRVGLETAMEDAYFGEGLTLVGSSRDDDDTPYLLQLTWRKGVAFCYDPETLVETCRFDYKTTNGEGWGIAYDTTANNTSDSVVYVTDGTDYLHTWRLGTKDGSRTYAQTDRVPVQVMLPERDSAQRIPRLNELEYDATSRTLLANVWFENVLLRIDPHTGWVTTVYDLSSLYTDRAPGADVLNGIAVLPGTKGRELWVTGKLWPVLYHIELID
jgi:glutamine cyclotransferase